MESKIASSTTVATRLLMLLSNTRVGLGVLLIVCGLSLAGHAYRGYLQPILNPDSEGYIQFQWDLSDKGFNGLRTPGYPLFLQSIMATFGLDAVPTAHAIAYFVAVVAFHLSLLGIGYRPLSALAVSVPLALGVNLSYLGSHVLTDSLALSVSIMAMAAFTWTLRKPTNTWSWLTLAFLTFVTYQVRPAYLFLLVLWPLMGVWVAFFFEPRFGFAKRCFHRLLAYSAVSVIPFFSYTILRGLVTGYFGLVAFGGYNIIGIAIQFLDPPTIARLPEEVKPLATAIVNRIAELDLKVDISSYNTMEPNYPAYVYQVSVHEAREIYGDDIRKTNAAFNKLSLAVFKIHPKLYLRWIVGNLFHGIGDQVLLTFRNIGTVLVFAFIGVVIFCSLWSPLGFQGAITPLGSQSTSSQSTDSQAQSGHDPQASLIGHSAFAEFQYLFWLSTWYSAGKTGLVILVEPSVGRYMAPASVLWPCVIALAAMHFANSLLAIRNDSSFRK
jgi:hypothetical protein